MFGETVHLLVTVRGFDHVLLWRAVAVSSVWSMEFSARITNKGSAKPDVSGFALSCFISNIYEGQVTRFYRVHPLELASRKKYYRTQFYSTQIIILQ